VKRMTTMSTTGLTQKNVRPLRPSIVANLCKRCVLQGSCR
jgi:hypothetical protein